MTVLVTGGAGFVGAHVVRDLLASGREVVVFDGTPNRSVLDLVSPGWSETGRVTTVRGSITDGWCLLQTCVEHSVERIVHLASPLTAAVNANLHAGVSDICVGTLNVFEAARALRLGRVVWASSISVFGPLSSYEPGPLPNDACQSPVSIYGACKALCERLAVTYRDAHGVDSVGLRLTIVYGPGRTRGVTSFVSDIVRRAASGEAAVVRYGDQRLNWQYVDDVAAMLVRALDAPTPRDTVFNTSGDVRSIRDAARVIEQLVPGSRIEVLPGVFDGTDGLSDFAVEFDDGLAREQLGVAWETGLEAGLAAALMEYRVAEGSQVPSTNQGDLSS